jgi:purine nucleoside phosphorylase
MAEPTLGVIGGSGLYELPGLQVAERVRLETPFGDASDEFVIGRLGGARLVFLPRHGRGHRLLPGELNFRANALVAAARAEGATVHPAGVYVCMEGRVLHARRRHPAAGRPPGGRRGGARHLDPGVTWWR